MGMGLMADDHEQDYYARLKVARASDDETLHVAYRTLARRYHPDVAGTGSLARMQQLNLAYTTLSNPERRRLYDLQRGLPTPPASPPHADESATTTPAHAAPPRAAPGRAPRQ